MFQFPIITWKMMTTLGGYHTLFLMSLWASYIVLLFWAGFSSCMLGSLMHLWTAAEMVWPGWFRLALFTCLEVDRP